MPIPGESKNFRQITLRFGVKHNMTLSDLQLNFHAHDIIQRQITQTRGQSNLTKSASRGAHSPVRGHPRGSKVVLLNSWGRVSY